MQHQTPGYHKLFIFGVFCMVVSLGLLLFALYILPNFLWDLHYDIPDWISNVISYLQDNYEYSVFFCKCVIWLGVVLVSAVMGYGSYRVSNYLEEVGALTPRDSQLPLSTGRIIKKSSSALNKMAIFIKVIVLLCIVILLVILVANFIHLTQR